MTVYDAHAHLGSAAEQQARMQQGIRTVLSCGMPRHAEAALRCCAASPLFSMTAGVHPWHAAQVALQDMLPYMARCRLIGEIGLDSVWCTTPMAAQRRALCAQLDWAAAAGKGVVLHTKGCEREIARAVEGFPHPVVIHWYSGEDEHAIARFLAQGCFFTIGPDIAQNPAVQAVAKAVPNERILFETDGMDAVRWALGGLADEAVGDALRASVQAAARLRGQSPQTLLEHANGNFQRLF